jgi:hypothetical protein
MAKKRWEVKRLIQQSGQSAPTEIFEAETLHVILETVMLYSRQMEK